MNAIALRLGTLAAVRDRRASVTDAEHEPDVRARGGRLGGALYTMMGAVGLGVGGGWALDRHLGTSPRWLIGLSMLGLVVGFYHLVREAMRK
ncbi:MAG TPA: AtpZ/AtpI family protein [Planctomycetota bacterium]|nr:AtpZ/AtpI family protein [Planctomycetota bacterium]